MAGVFSAAFGMGKRLDGRRRYQTVDGGPLVITRYKLFIVASVDISFLPNHRRHAILLETHSEAISHWHEISCRMASHSLPPNGLACTLIFSSPCSTARMRADIRSYLQCFIHFAPLLHVGGWWEPTQRLPSIPSGSPSKIWQLAQPCLNF